MHGPACFTAYMPRMISQDSELCPHNNAVQQLQQGLMEASLSRTFFEATQVADKIWSALSEDLARSRPEMLGAPSCCAGSSISAPVAQMGCLLVSLSEPASDSEVRWSAACVVQ